MKTESVNSSLSIQDITQQIAEKALPLIINNVLEQVTQQVVQQIFASASLADTQQKTPATSLGNRSVQREYKTPPLNEEQTKLYESMPLPLRAKYLLGVHTLANKDQRKNFPYKGVSVGKKEALGIFKRTLSGLKPLKETDLDGNKEPIEIHFKEAERDMAQRLRKAKLNKVQNILHLGHKLADKTAKGALGLAAGGIVSAASDILKTANSVTNTLINGQDATDDRDATEI